MGENNPMEQVTGRVSVLEREMGAVLEKLDHHTRTMDAFMPKMDQFIGSINSSRTDIVMLQRDSIEYKARLGQVEQQQKEHNDYVQRAIGMQKLVNGAIALFGLGSAVYQLWKG